MAVNLKSLIGKLNNTCRQALEGAAGLCVSQTNYNVELEHWFVKLMEIPNTDLSRLCRHFEINVDNLSSDLTRGIDQLSGFIRNLHAPAEMAWSVIGHFHVRDFKRILF